MTSITARRQVLRGACGFTLALPFLPSIERKAFGQPVPARQARFVAFTTGHGGLKGENMYPPDGSLTETLEIKPGHQISHGTLKRTVEGADAYLSAVLRAPATALTDRIVSKMNVLRGFNYPFEIVHHRGGHLGNWASNNGSVSDQRMTVPFPTIDQVMAWSPSFYPDLAGIKERVMLWQWGNTSTQVSYNWSNPATRSGAIQESRAEQYVPRLFDKIFMPSGPAPALSRKPIVDRVLESYRSLRSGNRRLSAGDRQRLDDHMGRIAELQRRMNVKAPTCSFMRPANPTSMKREYQAFVDVVVAGFICGTSRIAATAVMDELYGYAGDWHQDIAHRSNSPGPQATLVAGMRDFFASIFLDLASKLDIDDGTGSTYLDNTLIAWTQESGVYSHDGTSVPIVTAGRGKNFLRTGNYVDYRNKTPTTLLRFENLAREYAGLPYNQWLALALQAVGVPRSEFERNGNQGYGQRLLGIHHQKAFVPGIMDSASDIPRPLG